MNSQAGDDGHDSLVGERKLDSLFLLLRANGFSATPRQQASAKFIHLNLCTDGTIDLRRLRMKLAPIFSSSAEQQKSFDIIFEEWSGVASPTHVYSPPSKLAETDLIAGNSTFFRRVIAAFLGLFVLLMLGMFILPNIGDRYGRLPGFEPNGGGALVRNWGVVWWVFPALMLAVLLMIVLRYAPLRAGVEPSRTVASLPMYPWDDGILRKIEIALKDVPAQPTTVLSVAKTVTASARAAGLFSPIYRMQSGGLGYLFLIEVFSKFDHMAKYIEIALNKLKQSGILIETRYYSDDPRYCWANDNPFGRASFEDLERDFSGWHLIIVGSLDGAFHPITGSPRSWTELTGEWSSKTLLHTRPLDEWGANELHFLSLGFSLAQTSQSGLAKYSEAIGGRENLVAGRLLEGKLHVYQSRSDDLPTFALIKPFTGSPSARLLPTGVFEMGSPADEVGHCDDEDPLSVVEISQAFAIGQWPVTIREFLPFCRDANVSCGLLIDSDPDLPVTNVTWDEAVAYCEWLAMESGRKYRLPSEAEWEYACRAGTTTRFYWGDEWDASCANGDSEIGHATRVGMYAPNLWGLFDMTGNVWEWCADASTANSEAPRSQAAPRDSLDSYSRVARGGGWGNSPLLLRSACRLHIPRDTRKPTLGFRVAMSL